MKKIFTTVIALIIVNNQLSSQTLSLVTGKKLYDHHSSSLAGGFYGYFNAPHMSGYDFVNHTNVSSGVAAQSINRDMVEHNGYFGWNGSNGWGKDFGFTNLTSNIGTGSAQGTGNTNFYLNNSVSFSSLNTVNDLVTAYNSSLANQFDTAVAVGNVYIIKVRNSNMYVAMHITNVSNISSAQVIDMDNQQNITLDVYFEFEYKYGTLFVTSLDELTTGEKMFKVYPNPVADNIQLPDDSKFTSYRILNIVGQDLLAGSKDPSKDTWINVSSLSPEIYFLELLSNNNVYKKSKFVKY